jgi:hypothetical protein
MLHLHRPALARPTRVWREQAELRRAAEGEARQAQLAALLGSRLDAAEAEAAEARAAARRAAEAAEAMAGAVRCGGAAEQAQALAAPRPRPCAG